MKRQTGWERWKEMPPGGDTDALIGDLLRKSGKPPAISETRLRRIEHNLLARRSHARPVAFFRWALVAGLVLSACGIAVAVGGPVRLYRLAAKLFVTIPGEQVEKAPRVRVARVETTRQSVPPVEVAPEPAVAVEPLGEFAPLTATPPARPVRVAGAGHAGKAVTVAPAAPLVAPAMVPVAETDVVAEAALLQTAINRLRKHTDGAGAIAALDEYARRFPSGTLASEAMLTRVDALLALGRYDEALVLGRNAPDLPLARRRELFVIEAERLARGDCARAIDRFAALLDEVTGELRERVLYGRAGCRLRLGQQAAAKADFWQYLAEFPHGRFVTPIQETLSGK